MAESIWQYRWTTSRGWNFSSRKRETKRERGNVLEVLSIPRINARHWHRENHIRTQSSSSSLIDKLIFAREVERRTKRKPRDRTFSSFFIFSRQHFRGWTRFTAQIHQFVSHSLAGKKRREICKREIVDRTRVRGTRKRKIVLLR